MRQILLLAASAIALPSLYASLPIPGDATRGAQVFKDQKCVLCHSVNGEGGKAAPDLVRDLADLDKARRATVSPLRPA